jgi:TPP-dependent pyruvate/acetoin dehydrogenase alpha subunit
MNKQNLLSLYYQLLRIRLVEEEMASEYVKQEMRCPTHLCIGHEAIPVGVCAHLTKKDFVFSNHRSHGHYLAKGGNLRAMIAEIYGKETGCSRGWGGSQHLIDQSANFLGSTPIVGGTIPVAVGNAWASQMQKDHAVTVVFFGDAATEEGVFFESLNFAVLKKLPILFICENNLYSIFTYIRERQANRPIYVLGLAQDMYSLGEEGNDVLKVYDAAKSALAHIRSGKGPALIEFKTYRYREHCGPFFEKRGQRDSKLYDKWIKKDPIAVFTKYLQKKGMLSKDEKASIQIKITGEIKEAFEYAKKSEFPKVSWDRDLVYAK